MKYFLKIAGLVLLTGATAMAATGYGPIISTGGGGATNGVQMLNGNGTNTYLIGATLANPIAITGLGALSVTQSVTAPTVYTGGTLSNSAAEFDVFVQSARFSFFQSGWFGLQNIIVTNTSWLRDVNITNLGFAQSLTVTNATTNLNLTASRLMMTGSSKESTNLTAGADGWMLSETSSVPVLTRNGGTLTNVVNATATNVATVSVAGVVKPDGSSVTVDADGTVHANASGGTAYAGYTAFPTNYVLTNGVSGPLSGMAAFNLHADWANISNTPSMTDPTNTLKAWVQWNTQYGTAGNTNLANNNGSALTNLTAEYPTNALATGNGTATWDFTKQESLLITNASLTISLSNIAAATAGGKRLWLSNSAASGNTITITASGFQLMTNGVPCASFLLTNLTAKNQRVLISAEHYGPVVVAAMANFYDP